MCHQLDNMVDRALEIRATYFDDLNSTIMAIAKITERTMKNRVRGALRVVLQPGQLKGTPPDGCYVIYCGESYYFSRVTEDEEGNRRVDHRGPVVLVRDGEKAMDYEPDLQPVCEMVEAYYAMTKGHGKCPDHRINVPVLFIPAPPNS